METLFVQVLNMSITASYVILFVIAVRIMLKKAPKIFSYVLWLVVFFRLISPISFDSIFSLIPVSPQTIPPNIMYSATPEINSGVTVIDQTVNYSMPTPVVEASVNPMQMWIALGEVLWILGIVVLLTYSLFTTIRLYLKLKNSTLTCPSDNIYEMNGIKTPFIFGIIRPKIYLPLVYQKMKKHIFLSMNKPTLKGLIIL